MYNLKHSHQFVSWCRHYWRRQWQPTPVLLPRKSHGQRSLVGCSPWGCKESDTTEWLHDFTFTSHFPALEKEMATHSNVLTWRIPGTGEPGGLPSMGSHRVGHDWSDLAAAAAAATMENSMEVPQKTSCRVILQSYSWVYIQTKLLFEDACTLMFAEALFTVVETWKQPVHQQMNG